MQHGSRWNCRDPLGRHINLLFFDARDQFGRNALDERFPIAGPTGRFRRHAPCAGIRRNTSAESLIRFAMRWWYLRCRGLDGSWDLLRGLRYNGRGGGMRLRRWEVNRGECEPCRGLPCQTGNHKGDA